MANIILVGMTCSGKTTLAKFISQKYGYNYIDTDEIIELEERMSIDEIFTLKGENYFRERERDIIEKLTSFDNMIIASGGGMPIFFDNMSKLKKLGLTIFLDVNPKEIIKRARLVSDRPLLKNNIDEIISKMYEKRIKIYRKAHIIIKEQDKEKAICNIIEKIDKK